MIEEGVYWCGPMSILEEDVFLSRFQDGCEKVLTSNKLTVVTLENSPVTKEAKLPSIAE